MKKKVSLTTRLVLWTGLYALFLLSLMEGLCFFLLPEQPPSWLIAMVIVPALYKESLMITVAGLSILGLLLLWLVIRRVCRDVTDAAAVSVKPGKEKVKENATAEKEKRLHHDKKLFLHLVSMLQTEGRFLDFLNEDLDQYEDSQIGAAARGVHEHCNEALAKYIALQPLSSQEEEETVRVASGFDPGAYRLIGNVTGDPPFDGKLVHKGWRAGRLNMPDFSFSGDPEIIAPMEVNVE